MRGLYQIHFFRLKSHNHRSASNSANKSVKSHSICHTKLSRYFTDAKIACAKTFFIFFKVNLQNGMSKYYTIYKTHIIYIM